LKKLNKKSGGKKPEKKTPKKDAFKSL
jgi:hypothetical protein